MSFSSRERADLARLMLNLGPDAPTLCEGWVTRDLAEHLWIRENRPLAAAGMFVPAFRGRLESETRSLSDRPFEEIVAAWAKGPRVGVVDRLMNTVEHFVHHEDVRRGDGTVDVRELQPEDEQTLYRMLRLMAPRILSGAASPVVLAPEGHARFIVADRRRVARQGSDVVRIDAPVSELLLWVMGRDAVEMRVSGDIGAVKR